MQKKHYDELTSACDVGLIFLDRRFTIPNFPSRLLSYMEYSLPIVAATDISSDIGEVIVNGNFGWWCESKNPISSDMEEVIRPNYFENLSFEQIKSNFIISKSFALKIV